jgi:hypothetical protein
MKKITNASVIFLVLFQAAVLFAQTKTTPANNKNNLLKSETFNGLKFRSIGPALTSGRVVDLAINPNNPKEYFVAAAADHVAVHPIASDLAFAADLVTVVELTYAVPCWCHQPVQV